MADTVNDNRNDRFIPGLVLGIAAGICGLVSAFNDPFSVYMPVPSNSIRGVLIQLAFSAIAIWLGLWGKRAIGKKAPFYVLLALAMANLALSLVSMIMSIQIMGGLDTPIKAVFISTDIFSFACSLFPTLSVLFYLMGRPRACRITAMSALASFCLCPLPYALLYMTEYPYLGALNSFVMYVTTAQGFANNTAGVIFGTWAIFLYAGKYMARKKISDDSADVSCNEVTLQGIESQSASLSGYPAVLPDSDADIHPQANKGALTKKKRIIITAITAVLLVFLSFVGRAIFTDVIQQNINPELTVLDTYMREEYATDVPAVTVPLKEDSQREIAFKRRDVTVRFLGAGVDSEGELCVIADLINASNSTVDLASQYDSRVNGYPTDVKCRVRVEPKETLRVKMPVQRMVLEAARIDINNISSAFIPMTMTFGAGDTMDMGIYECTVYFESPETYMVKKEENKTKANSQLCYSDENVDIYYQGMILNDEESYLAFFMESKNPDVMYIDSMEVIPGSESVNFCEMASIDDDQPSAYLCGGVDVSQGIPETFECKFNYAIFQPKEDNIEKSFTFSVDPSKRFVE